MPFPDRRLYLLFTPALCRGEPVATLRAALRGGVDLVQWRSKQADPAGFQRARALCAEAGVPLVVNDDVMLAVRERTAGAHVGQHDMPALVARRLLGRAWLGVSTHDDAELAQAIADGADYVGFGPCFPTATKGYEHGQPPAAIAAAAAAAHAAGMPLFAIGGITAELLPPLRRLGIARIATSAAILGADDPERAAATLRAGL